MQKNKKNPENVGSKVLKTKNGRIMLLSKCAPGSSKRSKFMKEQEAKALLSSLGLKKPFNTISLLGHILFWMYFQKQSKNSKMYGNRKCTLYLQKWDW